MKDVFFVSGETYEKCVPILSELDQALTSFRFGQSTELKTRLREAVQPLAIVVVTIADEVFSDLQNNLPARPAGSYLHQTHLSPRKTQTLMRVLRKINHQAAGDLAKAYDSNYNSLSALIFLSRSG